MSERPCVSVIVVTFNSADFIDRCLDSLRAQSRNACMETVVFDNASTDDTVARVRGRSDCRLLVAEENLGFAAGCNAAAAASSGRYLLFVNPDAIIDGRAVEAALTFAEEHPQAGPIGCRTVRENGDVDPRSGWGRQTLWSTFCFGSGLSALRPRSRIFAPESLGGWQRDSVREVGTVTGYFLLLRRDHWQQLGGFDSSFFMYGEDVDLSERARAIGLRPTITPAAIVQHVAGVSSTKPDRLVMQLRGRTTFMHRHWSAPARRTGVLLLLSGVLLRAALTREPAWRSTLRRRSEWMEPYAQSLRQASELSAPADRSGSPSALQG